MGRSYKDLVDYLLGKKVDSRVVERIEYLHRISEHKRTDIPTPEEYERS